MLDGIEDLDDPFWGGDMAAHLKNQLLTRCQHKRSTLQPTRAFSARPDSPDMNDMDILPAKRRLPMHR
jgi:hypothetical protein